MKYLAILAITLLIIAEASISIAYAGTHNNIRYYSGPNGWCYTIKKSKKTGKTYKTYVDKKLCSQKK